MEVPKQQIRIGMDNTTALICDTCGNDTFVEVLFVRKVSKLLTGSSEDQYAPIPAYACAKCHNVNKQFRIGTTEPAKPESPIIQP